MNLERHALIPAVCIVSSFICITACVNEEYDLSKGIDTTINVNGDISAPLGSTEKILIGDFFEIDPQNSAISVVDGDYVLSLSGDMVRHDIDVPELGISGISVGNSENPGGYRINMDIPDIQPVEGVQIPDRTYEFTVAGEKETAIEINEEVPEYIAGIGKIELNSVMSISMRLSRDDGRSEGEITIGEGFSLVFPDYITIVKEGGSVDYEVLDGNVVRFASSASLTPSAPLGFRLGIAGIDFGRMPEGQGLVNGRIVIDDIIGMQDVSISANARSFGEVISDLPSSLSIDIDMSVSDIEIETVEVVFNPEITVDDQTVEIGEMPEFLSEEGNRLDLYSPVITLMVTNDSPVSAVLQADITSYSNDSQTASIHLGNEDAGAADAVVLRSGVTPVYIVRRAEDVPDGPVAATNDPVIIVRDDLSELIATIPDKMTVSDIDVRVLQETIEFDLVNAPDKYSFSFGYDINVPLAFGEELAVSYPYDITGLNETLNPSSSDDNGSLEIDFSEASVFLTFVNEIPLDLSVAASPIDKDGNVIGSGIDVELTGIEGNSAVTVGAGNVGSPSESPAVIRIRADKESLMKLDGFRLDLKGSCGSGFAGVALNENQGIQLKDISVNIKGGVSTQF